MKQVNVATDTRSVLLGAFPETKTQAAVETKHANPTLTHYLTAQLTTARSQQRWLLVLWPRSNKQQGYGLTPMKIVEGVSGHAGGPGGHVNLWGIRFLWSEGKQQENSQQACGSSVATVRIALHVHPFKLGKTGVQGLFPDTAKVNGAADSSGAAIEKPHSRALR